MDAFELWCWRRLLRVPWTARRANQSILKEINLEYSLEGLMLKLKPQYFGHLIWRTDTLEKILMLGKIEGGIRRGQLRMKWLDNIMVLMGMNLHDLWELVMNGEAWGATVHGVTRSQTPLNWTELNCCKLVSSLAPPLPPWGPLPWGHLRFCFPCSSPNIPTKQSLLSTFRLTTFLCLVSICLENSMDRRDWQTAVHRVAKIRAQLKRLNTNYL